MVAERWSLLQWLWEHHERNPINAFSMTDDDDRRLIGHPASQAEIRVEQRTVTVLREHGVIRGRTELTLTQLGLELGYALRRGERLSVEARAMLQQLRDAPSTTEE